MKVIIIEDEQIAANRLIKLIREIDESVEIITVLDSIETVVDWVEKEVMPDLFFMDIHLADGNCFEIFNRVKIQQAIIFTTAYDQYAIQSFQANAIDYLLKPIKKDQLSTAMEKYKNLYQSADLDYQLIAQLLNKEKATNLRRFLIRTGQNLKTIDVGDAAYFYTENKMTFLVVHDGKRYNINYSLEKLEEELDTKRFFRINRQFIINAEAIAKMVAVSKSRVKLILEPGNLSTIVSTERSGKFKKWLIGE